MFYQWRLLDISVIKITTTKYSHSDDNTSIEYFGNGKHKILRGIEWYDELEQILNLKAISSLS